MVRIIFVKKRIKVVGAALVVVGTAAAIAEVAATAVAAVATVATVAAVAAVAVAAVAAAVIAVAVAIGLYHDTDQIILIW